MSYYVPQVRVGNGDASMEREASVLWSHASPEQRQNVVLILTQVLRKEGLRLNIQARRREL